MAEICHMWMAPKLSWNWTTPAVFCVTQIRCHGREATETLEDLEFLGTCYTFSLLEITDNLQARFSAPKGGEFHLSKILLKSTNLQVHAAEWSVTCVKSELPDKTWMPFQFDEGWVVRKQLCPAWIFFTNSLCFLTCWLSYNKVSSCSSFVFTWKSKTRTVTQQTS